MPETSEPMSPASIHKKMDSKFFKENFAHFLFDVSHLLSWLRNSLSVCLTEMVCALRTEKSILVKTTRFCVFQRIFKIKKIRNLKLIASQLFGVSQSSHRSYLLVKSHFCCFLDLEIAAILNVQKIQKMQFYEQVWSLWWLRYSKELTYNKFEVSDLLNFEKILKSR